MTLLLGGGAVLAADGSFAPGVRMDYRPLAFYPERWAKKKLSTQLYPWPGEHLVFLTITNDLDGAVMARFLGRLEAGWGVYRYLVGRAPSPLKVWDGKAVIAAVPEDSLTCGYGCGYIGLTGIEVAGFYSNDYPLVQRDPKAFPHYYFYEMGRNFYLFGDRHSLFITGYAVFMRYVCMDALGCSDPDLRTRTIIESCEALYAASDIPFMDAFTTFGSGEKAHRLKDNEGRDVAPSDQPVMYATVMLKLRKDHGGDAWVKDFCRQLFTCPEVAAKTRAGAQEQLLNWLVAASVAAKQDLSPDFCDRWRMPLGPELRAALKKVDWHRPGLTAGAIIASLQKTGA